MGARIGEPYVLKGVGTRERQRWRIARPKPKNSGGVVKLSPKEKADWNTVKATSEKNLKSRLGVLKPSRSTPRASTCMLIVVLQWYKLHGKHEADDDSDDDGTNENEMTVLMTRMSNKDCHTELPVHEMIRKWSSGLRAAQLCQMRGNDAARHEMEAAGRCSSLQLPTTRPRSRSGPHPSELTGG